MELPAGISTSTYTHAGTGYAGARVVIPVGVPLKPALDAAAKRSTIMLVNSDGKPLTSDGFRAPRRKACAATRLNKAAMLQKIMRLVLRSSRGNRSHGVPPEPGRAQYHRLAWRMETTFQNLHPA
jgi:hypothetical protein